MMYQTPERKLQGTEVIRATFGLHQMGNQAPYFSLTGQIRDKRLRRDGGVIAVGALHEDILRKFPELAPLEPWHLVYTNDGPMHYEPNALYWWEVATGRRELGQYDPDPRRAAEFFANTIVFGAVPSYDDYFDMENLGQYSKPEVQDFLYSRLPGLLLAFEQQMDELPEIARRLHAESVSDR